MEHLRVSSILCIRLVVIDQKLWLRQKLLVEDLVGLVCLFEDVGLD